jgi:hypothetical protein
MSSNFIHVDCFQEPFYLEFYMKFHFLLSSYMTHLDETRYTALLLYEYNACQFNQFLELCNSWAYIYH